MRIYISALFVVILLPRLLLADSIPQKNFTGQVLTILSEYSKLKVGITRNQLYSQLHSTFVPAGGLSTIRQESFSYKDCSYIRFDVKFDLKPGQIDAHPTDTVNFISKLHIENGQGD